MLKVKRLLISLFGSAIIAIAITAYVIWSSFAPGGGGSTQDAPRESSACHFLPVRLRLYVWGAGGSVQGRYTDLIMHYRLAGDMRFYETEPKIVEKNSISETAEFVVPPFTPKASGALEYYFTVNFDHSGLDKISGKVPIHIHPDNCN